jgi:hypothetical protein
MVKRYKPLPSRREFLVRLARTTVLAVGVVAGSLFMGVCGYHYFVGLPWLDATLNASMILAGMGPVDPIKSDAGKVFASLYAIFSGVVFIGAVALLLAPVVHRFLHRFHMEIEPDEPREKK